MSTKLLSNPGARHTITDDLESHFFVLMWTALHWVKHDRPGHPRINMGYIFDQQCPYDDGVIMGGAGKIIMYESQNSGLADIQFACKPFNDLFWDLWMLFSKYLEGRRSAGREKKPGEYSFKLEP